MTIPLFDPARGYAAIAATVDAALLAVARSGRYVLAEHVAALEAEIACYVGVRHAIACNSGTDALHLALVGLGIAAGDEVITTPFTFAATLEAIEYVGATPVLVDIEPDTFNIDPALVEHAITPLSKALLPVHLFGHPAAMPTLLAVAARHGLAVIEDCAQALGASLDGRRVGGLAHAAALSFYPTKTLGGWGDGGMIATDDGELAARLRVLRNHGIGAEGEHERLGWNSRLDEAQAVLLRAKLARFERLNARRRAIAAHYATALSGTRAQLPREIGDARHVFGYYTILVDDRDALREGLRQAGIETGVYYRKPLSRHAHFARTCRAGPLPVAEAVSTRCLSLPVFPELNDDEVDVVATTVARLLR